MRVVPGHALFPTVSVIEVVSSIVILMGCDQSIVFGSSARVAILLAIAIDISDVTNCVPI